MLALLSSIAGPAADVSAAPATAPGEAAQSSAADPTVRMQGCWKAATVPCAAVPELDQVARTGERAHDAAGASEVVAAALAASTAAVSSRQATLEPGAAMFRTVAHC